MVVAGPNLISTMNPNHVSFEEVRKTIYEQIYDELERKDPDRLRFAPKGTARKVLSNHNLGLFFQSLMLPDKTLVEQFGFGVEQLVTRVKERRLRKFLAALLFASCGTAAARTFTSKLVAAEKWPVKDPNGRDVFRLPVERKWLEELFEAVEPTDLFFNRQACFCPVRIRKRENVFVQPDRERLPYLEEKPLARGSFGEVFVVKVARGHIYDPGTGVSNDKPEEVARKDYEISQDAEASEESDIINTILKESSLKCSNIIESYGSLQIGKSTYSLFMPLAQYDLRAYMKEHFPTKPQTPSERANIIRCAQGLAAGLDFLHNKLSTPESRMVCYHMDLKPSNVLVFYEGDESPSKPGRHIWKISDFGMARVKVLRQELDGQKEKLFKGWFQKRPQAPDSTPSATVNRRGEGTYLAPESRQYIPSMKTGSDVWSLGCILSVVFTYLERGNDGLEQYQELRAQGPDGCDRFFLPGASFRPPKLHPAVKNWHSYLIKKAHKRNAAEARIVKFVLRYLENRVLLVDQTKRADAGDVERKLRLAFYHYGTSGTDRATPEGASLRQRILSQLGSDSRSAKVSCFPLSTPCFSGFSFMYLFVFTYLLLPRFPVNASFLSSFQCTHTDF